MKLTEYERLSLANQYRILSHLDKDEDMKAHYAKNVEILLDGYEYHYSDQDHIETGEHVTSESESIEVLDILSMYEAIERAVESGIDTTDIEHYKLEFPGFDGNTESKQLGYANFYCRPGSGRFERLAKGKPIPNSHGPFLPLQKLRVAEWRKSADPNNLTQDDLIRITSVTAY